MTDEKNANLTIGAFILYAHETIEVRLNDQLVLSDINKADSDKNHYRKYLKVDYRGNNMISLKSYFKDSLVLDTSIAFRKEFDKYELRVSVSYPRNIDFDSLDRVKFPYRFGYVPIEQSTRFISLDPDTINWNDMLSPNELFINRK